MPLQVREYGQVWKVLKPCEGRDYKDRKLVDKAQEKARNLAVRDGSRPRRELRSVTSFLLYERLLAE